MATQEQSPQKSSKGYGKRSIWQWVVIYLIAAVIVYGLIYYIFIRHSGTGGGAFGPFCLVTNK